MKKDLHVAIAGATGAVGIEMLKTLEKRNFPVGKLTPLASKRSAGKSLSFRGEEVTVQELTKDSFAGVDIALFRQGGGHPRSLHQQQLMPEPWWWTTQAHFAWMKKSLSSCRKSTLQPFQDTRALSQTQTAPPS